MRRLLLLALVAVSAAALGCRVERAAQPAPRAAGEVVSIYVPCGMILPFDAASKKFEEENPGVDVKATYDNAGILVRKIVEKGERPDLFVSPGARELGVLEEKGLVKAGSKQALGSYEVVLLVYKGDKSGVRTWEDLRKDAMKTIATANPDANSIGWYARQGLQKMGIWKDIEPKLILTEHASEAYAMVSQGKVQAAFSYRTCPAESNPEKLDVQKVDIVAELPRGLYDPAQVLIGQLKEGKSPQLAAKLSAFLMRPDIQAVLAENGLPNERQSSSTGAGSEGKKPAAETQGDR